MAPQPELVYCLKCGSPDRLEPVEVQGPTPIVEGRNDDQKGWTRYWVKCFNCGGKQLFDSPDADLIVPPEPPVLPDMGQGVAGSIEQLAKSGQSMDASVVPPVE